jgi:ABC transport system ATP-binding/permease protein
MEEAIKVAEAELEKIHKDLEDPAVGADPARLQERCTAMAAAQEKIDTLFARWAELEAKQR